MVVGRVEGRWGEEIDPSSASSTGFNTLAKKRKQSKRLRLTPEPQRQRNEANIEVAKKFYKFTEPAL